jgi:hypothetical protein
MTYPEGKKCDLHQILKRILGAEYECFGFLPTDVLQAGKDLLGAKRSKPETGTSTERK